MSVKLADALVYIGVDDKALDRGLNTAKQKVNGWLRDVGGPLAQQAGQAIFGLIIDGARTAVSELGKSVDAAKDLNETLARTGQVYDENAKDVVAWSTTTARAIGVSQEAALSATGTLGNMFKQLGFGGGEAAKFSKTLVEASADIVAFHNVSEGTVSVLNDIQSAFRGEYDPIQKYIPLINAATVEQQALAETGKESADALTAGEKAAAAYTLILEGMGDAAGAAAREIDSAASQQRIFNARMEDGIAQLGQVLLPLQEAFYTGLNQLLDQLAPYGPQIINVLAQGLADGIHYLLPVMAQLHQFFAYWMKPQSPPRFLKDLTKWGQGALREYMKGWTDPDFAALNSLGSGIESILRSYASTGRLKDTDLVARVFGSQRGLVDAINEWRQAGTISIGTLDNIRRAAGPAGESVTDLVNSYFNLQQATEGVSEAQERLNEVNRKYDAALSPLQKKLDDLQDAQQQIRDEQRLEDLGDIINDPTADLSDRRAARYEQEEILLRQQIEAIEEEKQAALNAEQAKVVAAELERKAREDAYNLQKAVLEQQVEANRLLAEDIALRKKLADEAMAKQEQAAREAEQAARALAAEQERNADAEFRYQLAISDTAGQLALWQTRLDNATKGTADYYDALTQVYLLTQKLNDELDTGGGGGSGDKATQRIADLAAQYPGIEALRKEIGAVFEIWSGKTEPVALNPFWTGVIETIRDIGGAASDAKLIIGDFINFFAGKSGDSDSTSDILRPTYNSGLFGKVYTAVTTTLTVLRQFISGFITGDWQPLWTSFKNFVLELWTPTEGSDNPFNWTFLDWMVNVLIPAIEAVGRGEWAEAWEIFKEPLVAIGDAAYIAGYNSVYRWWQGFKDAIPSLPEALQELFKMPEYNWNDGTGSGMGPGGDGQTPGGGGGDFSSLPVPSIVAPTMPASIAGLGGTTNTTTITLGPFTINIPNPGGSAESAGRVFASSVDDELRRRGWSPT